MAARRITVGILAHVDAGKTTLSEALLYTAGELRRLGRVDHGDSFLDTDSQERERGITIFSKPARLRRGDTEITLLDTPGHVDFSGETERALSVLDCAILVISGADGVQSHTRTLWKLLEQYAVPTFLFVNKMDQPGTDRSCLLAQLRRTLSDGCVDYDNPDWMETVASESEEAMEAYLNTGMIPESELARLIGERKVFSCFFGSALKNEGVEDFLDHICAFLPEKRYSPDFGARVYKITHDAQGARLTWIKVTGGTLRVKETLTYADREEKINQIRLYSGEKFVLTEEAPAGTVCAVTGLSAARPGDGLGGEKALSAPHLEPVFSYQVNTGELDPFTVLQKLRILEEEDPLLHIVWNEPLQEIHLRLMGEVQSEILQKLIRDRFHMEVTFGEGSILYRETVTNRVEGVGHYEPLRHYAEVHILIEPLERGSGLQFAADCSTDELNLNWQRLILTHLLEKEHRGVLIGAPITDMKITLKSGRAHEKHTEGGDFRQATYRAVRQGLMSAQSVLLEPWYAVRLELPSECVGRAMTDLQRMGGRFDPPETVGEECILTGKASVASLRQYPREVISYTRGRGRLFCTPCGYEPCADAAAVMADAAYDAERDTENPADSVFCSHGAGFVVKWDKVSEYMHLDSCLKPTPSVSTPEIAPPSRAAASPSSAALDKELLAIYERTYGKTKERAMRPSPPKGEPTVKYRAAPVPKGPEYLLVDGYNMIFAWDELKEIAADSLETARQLLMDLLCNYQGVRGCTLILVFDAYRVPYHKEEIFRYHNIHVIYTKEAETADAYIEKATREIAKEHTVRVATSDGMEQLIILGGGALRLSARAFRSEIELSLSEIRSVLARLRVPRPSRAVADAIDRAEKMTKSKEGTNGENKQTQP